MMALLCFSCTTKNIDSANNQDHTPENNEIIDSDNDGLSDDEERSLGTDPNDFDTDGDGLADGAGIQRETDPNNPDSDGDGFYDAFEVQFGTDPRNSDDFPLLPNMTDWNHHNAQLTADDCNLDSILQAQGGDIFTFFPQKFEVIDASPNFFLFKIINSSPNGQGSMCTITDGDFTCEQLYNAVSLEVHNVILEFQIVKGGTIFALDQMDFSIELKLNNCDGDLFACSSLVMSGVHIPCSSFVTTEAHP